MSYRLSDFGSYSVGGRLLTVSEGEPFDIQFTRDARHHYDPRGTFAIEHAYVQFFVPEPRRDGPPFVLVHGGGMHGSTWETTPDGRDGWLLSLLRKGFEVHVIDNVERGRSGFVPDLWDGQPILRSMEEAWSLFRFGSPENFTERRTFVGQKFPVDCLEALARRFVPRWLSTSGLHVAALTAVLERTGPAHVICHSQGGEITFDTVAARSDLFCSLIAVEPSAVAVSPGPFQSFPTVLIHGDYLDRDQRWIDRHRDWKRMARQFTQSGASLEIIDSAADLAPGGSHLLMMDHHNIQCLDACLDVLSLNTE